MNTNDTNKGEMQPIRIANYDEIADVLHVAINTDEPSYREKVDNILYVDKTIITHKVIGFRLIDAGKHSINEIKSSTEKTYTREINIVPHALKINMDWLMTLMSETDNAENLLKKINIINRLLDVVKDSINKTDPIGLLHTGCPDDEYYPEIRMIVKDIGNCKSSEDVNHLIYNVFVIMFGKENAGDSQLYGRPSEEIYKHISY